MSNISTWSTTASNNNLTPPNGFPELMNPADLNNSSREVMAAVRRWYEDPAWINFGDTVTRTGATTFTITGNVTARYAAGLRIRCTDSSTLYGVIASSSYSAPNTTVTVTLDSGSLSTSLSAVALNPWSAAGVFNASAFGALAFLSTVNTAQIANNAVNGTKIAMGSDAQGDILYYNGTDYARLGAGTSGQFLQTLGVGNNPAWANVATETYATAQSTSTGTAFDFTGIPATAKRIRIYLDSVSLDGTDELLIQLGDSGGVETTGYESWASTPISGGSDTSTAGFVIRGSTTNAQTSGVYTIDLVTSTANKWVGGGNLATGAPLSSVNVCAGFKTLSATLDRVRLTRTGTNNFNNGSVNISYQ